MICWIFALVLSLVASCKAADKGLPADCEDIFETGHTLSGVYTIYPTGYNIPVQVYCDMGCGSDPDDKGRWTVIQRRMDGTVNFFRPWDHYKKGFGNKDEEYWLGLEWLHQLTTKRKYELKVDMEDFEGGKVHAQYSSFSVGSADSGYQLQVSGYMDGGAGNSLTYVNGMKFSTYDKDQDIHGTHNCALGQHAGFWFRDCYRANPNGLYHWQGPVSRWTGIIWYQWKGESYSLKSIVMKIRRVSVV